MLHDIPGPGEWRKLQEALLSWVGDFQRDAYQRGYNEGYRDGIAAGERADRRLAQDEARTR